jgi:hypothetical protein
MPLITLMCGIIVLSRVTRPQNLDRCLDSNSHKLSNSICLLLSRHSDGPHKLSNSGSCLALSKISIFIFLPEIPLENPSDEVKLSPSQLKIPFSLETAKWVKASIKHVPPNYLAMLILIAELTGHEPDKIADRYKALAFECARVYYGLGELD